jgi:hypothetical protein
MTKPGDRLHEDPLKAEEDDGSAEFLPEDGGTATPPPSQAKPPER